ncbi:DNA cytosine methyltransferase [Ralstonia mannitolilytica]|uniref:DNA cytosine methyltransferase n=1 Tax=Ralstonia mannitolilytica TaxID=105219 RepID=UPI003744486F
MRNWRSACLPGGLISRGADVVDTAIDLFAGIGGFTESAEQAGVKVVWAANHWRLAVDRRSSQ